MSQSEAFKEWASGIINLAAQTMDESEPADAQAAAYLELWDRILEAQKAGAIEVITYEEQRDED